MNPIHRCIQKDIARKPFFVRTGQDVRMYLRTRVMLYAPPPPPHYKWWGHKNNNAKYFWQLSYRKFQSYFVHTIYLPYLPIRKLPLLQ